MNKHIKSVVALALALTGGSLFAYNGGYVNGLLTDTTIGGVAYKGYGNNTVTAREESGATIVSNRYAQCKKLKAVNLSGVTSIGDAAFAYSALESVTIPSTVSSMGFIAFGGCTNLASVTVNNFNWYNASHEPFRDCVKLATLVANCAPPSWGVSNVFANLNAVRCKAADVAAWRAALPSATVSSAESEYTIVFSKNDGSGATKSQVMTMGVAAALPWPGSVLGWTRTGHSMVGWAIAPASTVATYANGETVTDIAAAGKTINLYAIWKPTASYSYKVQFHAMDGTGRTYDQTFAKDEAKCLAWLDSVLKWSRSGYIFCGWSTVGSSRVCNYNNGSKVSNLTLTPNGTVHLYAVWLSGTSHRIIFNRNLSATDTLTRQEVFWAGTEQTLAYLESQLGWNRKGYTFAGWAKTRDATAAQYANGQKVKDLAGKGKTLNLYALWRNNATGQIATSSANALSSAGAFGCARAGAAAGSSAASAGTVPQTFETTVFDLSGQAYPAEVVLHANGFAEAVVTTAGGEAYATGEGSVADGELKLELVLDGETLIR